MEIPRRTHVGRKILLAALAAVLAALALLSVLKRDTLRYLTDPDRIDIAAQDDVIRAVTEGNYTSADLTVDGTGRETLRYGAGDESVTVCAAFSGGRTNELSGELVLDRLTHLSLADALELAERLLLPYFDKSEIEALEIILVGQLTQYLSASSIDLSLTAGRFDIAVRGGLSDGVVSYRVTVRP